LKIKELPKCRLNIEKLYPLETKGVVACLGSGCKIKKVQKMRRGDRMLLKTNVEKMSVLWLDTMLMKRNELNLFYHDVDENKCG
jgi:hypothetical protein